MKKTLYLLFPLLLFVACQATIIKKTALAKKIKGDWVGDMGVFSFEDSLAVYVYEYQDYVPYQLKEDTLIIDRWSPYEDRYRDEKQYHFLIEHVSKSELSLQCLTPFTKDLFCDFEYNMEMDSFERKDKMEGETRLTFQKTTPKNKLSIKRIGFLSLYCPKRCTTMYLEIDSLGNLYFQGKRNTRKDGLWSGKLQAGDLDVLTEKVRAIELDSLKEIYRSPSSFPIPLCAIEIVTSDGVYKSEVYGTDQDPIELRFLLNKLRNIYDYASLEKDSTVQDKFQFEELQKTFAPPEPPPPPPVPRKFREE